MKNFLAKPLIVILFSVAGFSFSGASKSVKIQNLRCEYLSEPVGIDVQAPRFTWEYQSPAAFQPVAYSILIASELKTLGKENGDVWTSDKMEGTGNSMIYRGAAKLKSHTKYYWKVQVWDERGKRHESEPASFETAKMSLADWSADWISDNGDKDTRPSPMFRKAFEISRKIKQARVYVSAQGYYEMWINGVGVGDKVLDPGYTHFDKRSLYSTYDVTKLIQSGENVISTVLGNGFMNVQSLAVWNFETARWRQRPLMICELHIEYTNGEKIVINSGANWKTSTGPYIFNNIYSGDWYDARLEIAGWQMPGFDDSRWENAVKVKAPAPIVESEMFAPIRVTREVNPVSMRSFSPSLYVLDMGVNMSGFCKLKITGEAGAKVNIKYGERLYPSGRLDQSNIDVFFSKERNEDLFQTDCYIMKGDPQGEEFTPAFNYKGYQYVEIESSAPITIRQEDVTGLFVHTDVNSAGNFSCSNPLLNQLWQAANQSYLSNLHSIPTDCPQREKNGWTADAWASIEFALLNFDGIKVYEKWMNDFIDNQRDDGQITGIIPSSGWGFGIGPVWDAAMFIIPRALYDYYGDLKTIETIYPACEKYLDFLLTKEENGLTRFGLGDWLPYKTHTPQEFTSACYYYNNYVLMSGFAELLGNDARRYRTKSAEIRQNINEQYFDKESALYSNGSMAAQALALYLNIVPAGYEQRVADVLAKLVRETNHHVDFGLLGTKTVLRVLTKYGYVEDAYKLIAQTEEPSWGAWITKRNMTTLPERWTIDDDPSLSYNHPFFGDFNAWFYNTLAGINFDPLRPGFEHVIICPAFVKDLEWAKGEYHSVKGTIRSEWKRAGNKIELYVTIPANVTATVYAGEPARITGGTHKFVIED